MYFFQILHQRCDSGTTEHRSKGRKTWTNGVSLSRPPTSGSISWKKEKNKTKTISKIEKWSYLPNIVRNANCSSGCKSPNTVRKLDEFHPHFYKIRMVQNGENVYWYFSVLVSILLNMHSISKYISGPGSHIQIQRRILEKCWNLPKIMIFKFKIENCIPKFA